MPLRDVRKSMRNGAMHIWTAQKMQIPTSRLPQANLLTEFLGGSATWRPRFRKHIANSLKVNPCFLIYNFIWHLSKARQHTVGFFLAVQDKRQSLWERKEVIYLVLALKLSLKSLWDQLQDDHCQDILQYNWDNHLKVWLLLLLQPASTNQWIETTL